MAKRPRKKEVKKEKKEPLIQRIQAQLGNINFMDEKLKVSMGIFVLVVLLVLTVSMISFLFTGAADQSKLNLSFTKLLFNPNVQLNNWAGKIGAYLSNIVMNKGFGVGAFASLYFIFVAGFKLLGVETFNLWRSLRHSILIMMWVSLALGYFFVDSYQSSFLFLGGTHGFYVGQWLQAAIGGIGTTLIILALPLVFYIKSLL